MNTKENIMSVDIFGIIPPVVTPFDADGEIVIEKFRAQIRFLLAQGVHGICVGGSTGEGHTLTSDEFALLMNVSAEEVAGKVPLIAGIIANSTREAILRARRLKGLGIAGLQITPVHYLFKPDDDATVDHFRAIADAVPEPIVIYNVIPWNYLSPALLVRVMNTVPGVIGVKQSAGDLKLMADLLLNIPAGRKVLTAIDALLYPSFVLGAHGVIAANPAAVPGPCVRLWNAVQAGDHGHALELHARLLRFWNTIVGDTLPACVKYALELQGCPASLPRAPMRAPAAAQRAAIKAALAHLLALDGETRVMAAE